MPNLDPTLKVRMVEMTNEILALDRRYQDRLHYLQNKNVIQHNIDTDLTLGNLAGGAKTLSAIVTALGIAYIVTEWDTLD